MKNLLEGLEARKLIHPPRWLTANVAYLTVMGSTAYGSNDDDSDLDIYGFVVPPKVELFPYLAGHIPGFGTQVQRFEQWSEHHIDDPSARSGHGQQYDFSVYSIVKFFQLCMENNPNMLDAIFVPRECVIISTPVAELVREKRRTFLHKGCKFKTMGFAFSQAHKIKLKSPEPGSKRAELIAKHGYDTKYAGHLIRLVLQCEQLLVEGDLDLRRNKELLKEIRRGEWSEARVMDWFNAKQLHIEKLYEDSKALPDRPDEPAIKELLLNCLEHHYGNLRDMVVKVGESDRKLAAIKQILES